MDLTTITGWLTYREEAADRLGPALGTTLGPAYLDGRAERIASTAGSWRKSTGTPHQTGSRTC